MHVPDAKMLEILRDCEPCDFGVHFPSTRMHSLSLIALHLLVSILIALCTISFHQYILSPPAGTLAWY